MTNGFRSGDYVIYRKTKFSRRPGPRANNVRPSSNGDSYAYTVDKFWVVQRIADDGTIVLKTPGGKVHHVEPSDPQLRRANLLGAVAISRSICLDGDRRQLRSRFEFQRRILTTFEC